MKSLFKIKNVDICLGSSTILKNISFDIFDREFLGIIGPNGSGKSTLIKSLAGILTPAKGSVTLEERELSKIPRRELARSIAVVPQDSPIAFDYTVMEIVLMGRSPYMKRFELESNNDFKIAENALVRSNLVDLADRNAGELSGGERQRVMVARALAQGSPIIFLDEPTAHLDLNYQVEVLHLVKREITDNNKTGVVVLHDLNLASEFCDRLLLLHNGSIAGYGVPEEVINVENIKKVYGTSVWIRKHPTSGRPYVLSMGSQAIASKINYTSEDSARIHVIGGGGSGSRYFIRLLELGCDVTTGIINIGDTDQETAESLGIEYVEDAPFSPMSEIAVAANKKFIDKSDAVLICNVPFGTGNLANLETAVYGMEHKKHIGIIGSVDDFAERDFTGGHAIGLFNMLINNGAAVLDTDEDMMRWVDKIRVV